ncbi:pre-mRNA 3'-end-processing factor FIP1-like [Ostrea edulis]|uniref:pre-mRNA 3'-end-processing factor FIP1-like n=1 Tax=Ostrea edulis TaxID=37623 RepID=UPI0024AF65C3|nr:pre-mRNA 3'-end-processing factor FIP1-like [Ostrea edulis]
MATEVQTQAAPTASNPAEDDETWLYGEESKEKDKAHEPSSETGGSSAVKENKKDDREAGELSGEEESQGKGNDDDDDSDDDVQVTIGDIQAFPLGDGSRSLFKAPGYQKTGAGTTGKGGVAAGPQKGVDVEGVGTINGIPAYDFDLETLQADEKPWRKPGADITDYFNYGFNEDTWQQYCEKQRRLRGENQGSRSYTHGSSGIKKDMTETPQNVPVLSGRKAIVSVPRKTSGTIDVIGGTARDSRRPEGEPIQVAGKYPSAVPPHPPPGMDFSIPPPGMAPPGVPPPGMPVPPGVPPPGIPGIPPPGFPDFDPFFPPPGQPTNTRYEDRPPYNYDSQHTSYPTSYPDTHSSSWDRTETYWREYVGRDRSPARSESEFSSSGSERDYRYRETPRSSRYDRERDSYRRDRDSERTRDRDRDRSRERDRDRDRDRRHRDDKHKSRRKDKEEDSSRSKHKKSKRSRRDKEEESGNTGSESTSKAD